MPDSDQPDLAFLERSGKPRLAYRLRHGAMPALLFLPGYASDMEGSKALALDAFAAGRGAAIVRFDYSGTGASEGDFADGTLSDWVEEAVAIADRLIEGPFIPIGSSMGAWIALHLGLRLPMRVKALVGIAAAPDFTDWGLTSEQKAELAGNDVRPPNSRATERSMTSGFWKSGQAMRMLNAPIPVDCPVRLIHGDADADVPLEIAFKLMRQLRSADVQLNILKGSGHRLSEPHEIDAILRSVAGLLERA